MEYVDVAAGMITDEEGKILICQRTGALNGLWEFPGGKREKKETFQDCLTREIKEELELDILPGASVGQVFKETEGKMLCLVFVEATADSSQPLSLHVHSDAKWVRKDDLKQYAFCPADEAFLKQKDLL